MTEVASNVTTNVWDEQGLLANRLRAEAVSEEEEGTPTIPKKRRRRRRRRRKALASTERILDWQTAAMLEANSYIMERQASGLAPHPDHVVSLDCEMVGVGPFGSRSVLARVSLVDWFGKPIFDSFVKVEERVTDYRTFVSGVRPGDLDGPLALDFGKCRATVQQILSNKILVGHALSNDLKVLHLNHPWFLIRDSAEFQPFLKPNMKPHRLKDLAWSHLGLVIQKTGDAHDSIEDAWAAMQLYQQYQVTWDGAVRNTLLRRPLTEFV